MVKAFHLGFCLSSVVLVALGCGTVKNNPDSGVGGGDDAPVIDGGGGGSFTLSATPTALSIPIAGSAMATLSVDRTGTPGDIMLSAGTLPAGLTVVFAVNPIPAGTASTTATIAVAAGTAAGVSNVTITAAGGGAEKTVTIAVTATTITVSGKIRGDRAGVQVRIPGKPLVTSAADGSFSFTDVSPPYDLYALGSSGLINNALPTVFYYQGLTRTDPIITAPSTFSLIIFPFQNTAMVQGTATTTAPATMLVAWDSGGSTRVAQTNAYAFTASWIGTLTRTGSLFGFQFATDAVTGAPTGFTGYGSLSGLTLDSANTTPTVANLVMQTPATAALTGMITSPAGFPTPNITLTQQLGAAGSVQLWQATTNVANSVIPLVGAGKAALFASATLAGASTQFVYPALAAATDVTFALPSPAIPTAPLNMATNVNATTPFTWSATPGALYEVIIGTPSNASVKAVFQLYTTAATGTIPVVPELALPLNQSFSWRVNGYGPNTSTDAAASTAGLQFVSSADFEGTLHWTTNGTSSAFTSAP